MELLRREELLGRRDSLRDNSRREKDGRGSGAPEPLVALDADEVGEGQQTRRRTASWKTPRRGHEFEELARAEDALAIAVEDELVESEHRSVECPAVRKVRGDGDVDADRRAGELLAFRGDGERGMSIWECGGADSAWDEDNIAELHRTSVVHNAAYVRLCEDSFAHRIVCLS